MRARRNERTRNLKRSSSVWMIMRRKLALGSVLPVCSSTSSILYRLYVSQCVSEPEGGQHTCLRILSRIRSINASGHGNISGALRSVTHARVTSCRSRVSGGTAWSSTSAKMSSMSIDSAVLPLSIGPLDQELQDCTLLRSLKGMKYCGGTERMTVLLSAPTP